MDQPLIEHLASIADRLGTLAKDDERLRSDLRALAQYFLQITEQVAPAPLPVPPTETTVVPATAEPLSAEPPKPVPSVPQSPLPKPRPALTLGQPQPHEAATVSPVISWTTPSDAEFPVIEARCHLKAEGCRWAATRRRLLTEGAHYGTEIDPVDREIIARAKATPDCFLWMCNKEAPQPDDTSLYEVLAGCFENLADALSVVKQVLDEPGLHENLFEAALDLLAEAQSAVRAAILELHGRPDFDQLRVFNWLKDTATANQIFIRRHMRMDDPADPREWSGLAARIGELDGKLQEAQQKNKIRRKLIGKVRYRASVIAKNPHRSQEEWEALISNVEELLSSGLPPSNRELRDAILPVIDTLPEMEYPKGFGLVMREIDRYIALTPAPVTSISTQEQSPDVQEVAKLLKGKSMVLIGGDRRAGAHDAIVEAFGLKELIWIETRDHQPIAGFEHSIARPEVALALLAIRWSSHSFGDTKQFCDKHGKPLVRLPTGYNPGQIASQILSQCSERLQKKE